MKPHSAETEAARCELAEAEGRCAQLQQELDGLATRHEAGLAQLRTDLQRAVDANEELQGALDLQREERREEQSTMQALSDEVQRLSEELQGREVAQQQSLAQLMAQIRELQAVGVGGGRPVGVGARGCGWRPASGDAGQDARVFDSAGPSAGRIASLWGLADRRQWHVARIEVRPEGATPSVTALHQP